MGSCRRAVVALFCLLAAAASVASPRAALSADDPPPWMKELRAALEDGDYRISPVEGRLGIGFNVPNAGSYRPEDLSVVDGADVTEDGRWFRFVPSIVVGDSVAFRPLDWSRYETGDSVILSHVDADFSGFSRNRFAFFVHFADALAADTASGLDVRLPPDTADRRPDLFSLGCYEIVYRGDGQEKTAHSPPPNCEAVSADRSTGWGILEVELARAGPVRAPVLVVGDGPGAYDELTRSERPAPHAGGGVDIEESFKTAEQGGGEWPGQETPLVKGERGALPMPPARYAIVRVPRDVEGSIRNWVKVEDMAIVSHGKRHPLEKVTYGTHSARKVFGGEPGFWEVGPAPEHWHVRVPEGLEGPLQLHVEASDDAIACDPADLVLTADAYAPQDRHVTVRCHLVESGVTVAIDDDFDLTGPAGLVDGPCQSFTGSLEGMRAYCLTADEETGTIAFDARLVGEPGKIYEAGDVRHARSGSGSEEVIEVTARVRPRPTARTVRFDVEPRPLPSGLMDLDLEVVAALDEAPDIGLRVSRVAIGEDRRSVSLELDYGFAPLSAWQALTSATFTFESDDPALRFEDPDIPGGAAQTRVSRTLPHRSEPGTVHEPLRLAGTALRLPDTFDVVARTVTADGADYPGDWFCRVAIRVGDGEKTWLEKDGTVARVPEELRQIDLDAIDLDARGISVWVEPLPSDEVGAGKDPEKICGLSAGESFVGEFEAAALARAKVLEIPHREPVLVYFMRSQWTDDRLKRWADRIYQNWLENLDRVDGERILAIREPGRRTFETVAHPRETDPMRTPLDPAGLTSGRAKAQSNRDLKDIFEDARAVKERAGLPAERWPDMVIFRHDTSPTDLGEDCRNFALRVRAHPVGAHIVLVEDFTSGYLENTTGDGSEGRWRSNACVGKSNGGEYHVTQILTKFTDAPDFEGLVWDEALAEPLGALAAAD